MSNGCQLFPLLFLLSAQCSLLLAQRPAYTYRPLHACLFLSLSDCASVYDEHSSTATVPVFYYYRESLSLAGGGPPCRSPGL